MIDDDILICYVGYDGFRREGIMYSYFIILYTVVLLI